MESTSGPDAELGPNGEVGPEGELDESAQPLPQYRPRHGGSVLMAAMIGLAEVFDMAPKEPTEQMQPGDLSAGDDLDLDFGDLPPLDN